MDLKLKFSSGAVQNALGNPQPGQMYDVWITGEFMDGTRILGSDSCVAVSRSWSKWLSGSRENRRTDEELRRRIRFFCCDQHNNRQERERGRHYCAKAGQG